MTDDIAFAHDLADFLVALRSIDATDGPPAGTHSHGRGARVAIWDQQTRDTIAGLGPAVDAVATLAAWDTACTSEWSRPPVWVHGDVAPSNLLVRDGRLAAVLDFGCSAVGDPACDLVMAWTWFAGRGADEFKSRLDLDSDTWARARGWALWKALLVLAGPDPAGDAARGGWRFGAAEVIDAVLAAEPVTPVQIVC